MRKLSIGDTAPAISSVDQEGKEITLDQYKGKKLVLYFYPKDNTPGCTAESCDLRDHYDQFLKQGIDVVGVSADSVTSHQKFIASHKLPFRLISDTEKKVLQDYGVWGEKKNYGKTYMGIIRTTFVIDEEGIIINIIEKVKTKEHSTQIFNELSH